MDEIATSAMLLISGVLLGYALARIQNSRLFTNSVPVSCEVIEKVGHQYRMLVNGKLKLRGSVTVWNYEDTGERASAEIEEACYRTWRLSQFKENPGNKP
jgi:hypothetical protein